VTIGTGLSEPTGVAVDSAGDVIIADFGNNRVLKVAPNGTQTTVASELNGPDAVAVDSAGDIFIADKIDSRILEVTPTGIQTTVGRNVDVPDGVAVDGAGDVFIAESGNDQILKVTPGLPVTVSLGTTVVTPPATPPVTPASTPPVIIGEQPLFQRKLKHGKPTGKPLLVGYIINFSTKLNPASADLATNYQVDALSTKKVKKNKVTLLQPLSGFDVSYNDAGESVSLLFTTQQTFKKGGQITVLGGPSTGVTGLSGAFVSGNRVLKISPGGKNIG
jgi:hypothetical protein